MTAPRFPFPGNPLRSRADWQRALLQLCAPLDAVTGGQDSAVPGATHTPRVAALESTARPLWGLAPLAAGGGHYSGWGRISRSLARGTDPTSPRYWGEPGDMDQRLVEAAAIGFGLALAPDRLWGPLAAEERERLAGWLRQAASAYAIPDNNWHLFPVLVNLGLESVGEAADQAVTAAAFDRVEDFHRGGGWYSDGPEGSVCDYYGPWGIHFYALLHTVLARPPHAALSARARERATAFAADFQHWFAADGAALPFGRSLGYRFAQSAFWGALAFADTPALPWGRIRALWATNLRWWARQPICEPDGALSVGYAYPNLQMSEQYNAPGSPYWACKAFLPLALPARHPFWTAPEQAAPAGPALRAQPAPGLLLQRSGTGQVTALAVSRTNDYVRHGEAKYGKFAYSTAFGFAVPTRSRDLQGAGFDSALALSDDGVHWRVRENGTDARTNVEGARISWNPWPDVEVETELLPAGPWHLRLHRITTGRRLWTAEGGFCVPDTEVAVTSLDTGTDTSPAGHALAESGGLISGIRRLRGATGAELLRPDPNSHLLWPRTLLPTLRGELTPGTHRLATAVLGADTTDRDAWTRPPNHP
ncbi:DUF2264 domain-containing protein [Streptacidiphilus sp. EB103A]|uniref:DUF2264 domain-containing protein n=1 Tax=Streptacidiphilus sp. EB103A TaxID=3156275 RepID=UPI00351787C8